MADSGLEGDDFTNSEDLLNSITYGIRKFYFSGSWDNIILGVVLEETIDSFLVALPVKLTIKENISELEEILEVPYVRFLKTDFRAVTFVAGLHKAMYIKYITIKSPSEFPELLNMIGEDVNTSNETQTSHSIQQMREDLHEVSLREGLDIPLSDTAYEHDESIPSEGILVKGNITDTNLKNTVEDALKEGRFLPPQGKLPN